jgi:hypothetical protein
MPQRKSIDDYLAEAEDLIHTYEEVSGTEVPRTLKEARDSNWKLIAKGLVIDGLVGYHDDERKHDRQRTITLPVALRALEIFEDNLIAATIKNPKQLFVSRVRGQVRMLTYAKDALVIVWDFIKLEWESHGLLELLLDALSILGRIIDAVYEVFSRFAGLLVAGFIYVLGTQTFSRTVLDVQIERERIIAQIRKNALPQRSERRYWRRKVTRL